MFYDNVCKICDDMGVSPTTVLRELGFSTGNISKWKNGSVPNVDIALAFARHLGVSLDYLCTLEVGASDSALSPEDRELLDIFARIPEEKKEICKDFLRTHMVIPEKYADRKKA